jgi:hypothetical protein
VPETLVNLRTRVQGRADLENDANVATSLLTSFINASRKRLRRVLVTANPWYFVKSASFTLSGSTYTYNLAANVTDFWKSLALDRVLGTAADQIAPVPRFMWRERFSSFDRSYRIYTGTLEIRPAGVAAGSYVLWYINQPAALSADGDAIDLAEDMWDEFIVLDAAIKARKRQQKNSDDLVAELKELTEEILRAGADSDVGEPDRVIDVESATSWRERLPLP